MNGELVLRLLENPFRRALCVELEGLWNAYEVNKNLPLRQRLRPPCCTKIMERLLVNSSGEYSSSTTLLKRVRTEVGFLKGKNVKLVEDFHENGGRAAGVKPAIELSAGLRVCSKAEQWTLEQFDAELRALRHENELRALREGREVLGVEE